MKVEEDQGGKGDSDKSTRDSKRDGRVKSNRAELGFRSDRAAKTNRRAFCSRSVAGGDYRRYPIASWSDIVDRIVSIKLLCPPIASLI